MKKRISIALKTCPCCKRSASLIVDDTRRNDHWVWIECDHCGLQTRKYIHNLQRNDAIALVVAVWNTRLTTPAENEGPRAFGSYNEDHTLTTGRRRN